MVLGSGSWLAFWASNVSAHFAPGNMPPHWPHKRASSPSACASPPSACASPPSAPEERPSVPASPPSAPAEPLSATDGDELEHAASAEASPSARSVRLNPLSWLGFISHADKQAPCRGRDRENRLHERVHSHLARSSRSAAEVKFRARLRRFVQRNRLQLRGRLRLQACGNG